MDRRRVVITGIGVISPVGLDLATAWENLTAGRSGIGPITAFDTTGYDVTIAGEAHGFDPLNYLSLKEVRRTDRFTQFALAALQEALDQAKLVVDESNCHDVGVIIGVGVGGIQTYSDEFDVLRSKGPRRVSPLLVPMITSDVPAVQVALRTGARGPNLGVSSACASGSDAIGQAYETICRGHAEAMITGGVEAAIVPISIATFDRMRAISHRNDDPQGASRPFDAGRDGFVVSEGGALLILEELGSALRRGAEPLAEMAGYAATSDAIHLAAPDSEGAGAALCMTLAMQRAGVPPEELGYINAHGTSTPLGDPAESRAIREALGAYSDRVPVSSTKSMTGHMIGGAGSFEAAVCVQVLRTGILPPTINLTTPDPACDLDYVPGRARAAKVTAALSNSFGFGGHNCSLVLRSAP